jgi:hypothetical protein
MNESLSPGERVTICTFTLLVISIWAVDLKAQLARSTWAQGGSGYYSSQKSRGFNTNVLNIEARAGYFFVDRLVAGLGFTYQRYVAKTVGGKNIHNVFGIGPFVRYYFLTQGKKLL